jgi:FkbM family methyltransferase
VTGIEIHKADTVVDIGAHVGFFSILAAMKAKGGHVYAFEPAPENFSMLKENVSLNGIKNITVINHAVSHESGTRNFVLYPESSGAHSFTSAELNQKNVIQVSAISFESFIHEAGIEAVHFLKMDCEGAEYEILFNCSSKTLHMIRAIGMEYHNVDDEHTVQQLEIFLKKNHFHVQVNTCGDNMLWARSNSYAE